MAFSMHWGTRCGVLLCRVLRFIYYYAECRYAERRYAECRYGERRYAERRGAVLLRKRRDNE
jgi:hypothetical protein